MSWLRQPVLVTGGTGLLGSCLVRMLIDSGAPVGVLTRDYVPTSPYFEELHKSCWSASGDVTDFDTVERVINEFEVETVIHLAAQTIVGTANRNPRSTFETNVRGTWNVLEACRRVSTVKRVIVASSDKAYGDHGDEPYTEDAPLRGRHPYDVSKSCADLIARSYHASYNLPVCVTRCGNLYGGGDLNYSRLIPGTIRSALQGERPVVRSDGQFVRDYFYVRDAALAYIALASEMDRPEVLGQAFNFSTDTPYTVLEVVERVLAATGRSDLAPVILNEASNEIRKQTLSSAKARALLGWAPRWNFENALAETVDWYRARP